MRQRLLKERTEVAKSVRDLVVPSPEKKFFSFKFLSFLVLKHFSFKNRSFVVIDAGDLFQCTAKPKSCVPG
jgi:hypothetical protein